MVTYDAEHDRTFMRCFRGDLRKCNLDETEEKESKEKDEGVESLSLDDLEV